MLGSERSYFIIVAGLVILEKFFDCSLKRAGRKIRVTKPLGCFFTVHAMGSGTYVRSYLGIIKMGNMLIKKFTK